MKTTAVRLSARRWVRLVSGAALLLAVVAGLRTLDADPAAAQDPDTTWDDSWANPEYETFVAETGADRDALPAQPNAESYPADWAASVEEMGSQPGWNQAAADRYIATLDEDGPVYREDAAGIMCAGIGCSSDRTEDQIAELAAEGITVGRTGVCAIQPSDCVEDFDADSTSTNAQTITFLSRVINRSRTIFPPSRTNTVGGPPLNVILTCRILQSGTYTVGVSWSPPAGGADDYRLWITGFPTSVQPSNYMAFYFQPATVRAIWVRVETMVRRNDPNPTGYVYTPMGSTTAGPVCLHPPEVSVVGPVSAVEGSPLVFTLELSKLSSSDVAVTVSTEEDTRVGVRPASAVDDYVPLVGTATPILADRTVVTIPAGQLQATVSVDTLTDPTDEYYETLLLRINRVSGTSTPIIGDVREAAGTIIDTNPPPAVSIDDGVGDEAGIVRFNVKVVGASEKVIGTNVVTTQSTPRSAVGVGICDADDGSMDYLTSGGRVIFDPGETSKEFTVQTCDDVATEPSEMFDVTLSGPANATLGVMSAVGVIRDDDIPPPDAVRNLALICSAPDANGEFTLTATWDPPVGAVSVQVEITDQANVNLYAISAGGTSPYTATVTAEGIYRVSTLPYLSGGLQGQASEAFVECPSLPEVSVADAADAREGVALAFTVSLSAPSATDVTVEVVAVGVTATEGVDFLTRSGTVTILAGATSKDVFVFSVADLDVEVDETLRLDLSSPTGALPSAAMSATGRILDDDEPTISIEGPGGPVEEDTPGPLPNSLTFTVSLDVAGVRAVTVNVTTTAGTATGGTCGSGNADYADQSTPITFNPGDLTKDFTVQTCPDTLSHEGTEDFTVTISNPTGGATIGNATATGRINDNDSPPIYR